MTLRIASLIFLLTNILSYPLAAQSKEKEKAPSSSLHKHEQAAPAQSVASWHKADPKRVCMVTDMEFPRDQIPIKVKDRTYYGCCENCKERLGTDEVVRKAVDPISGKSVDKAKASIAAGPDGSVVYFENDANLEKFIASKK